MHKPKQVKLLGTSEMQTRHSLIIHFDPFSEYNLFVNYDFITHSNGLMLSAIHLIMRGTFIMNECNIYK